ncbi:MAG: hypothetical protein HXN12_05060 [Porphyromonadaceae bacterium]|nr:hypothetical protein [Porphyromonadaceae bacterium]
MSYNVENFFDTEDDPTHDDDSFLPTGEHHWTHARYQTKIQHIAEVISAVGGEAFPDLIALMEVENATVLSDLLHRTALGEKAGYRHIITHGEDKRGINVALLYAPETFRLIASEEIPIHFPFDSLRRTRSLLRVTGEVPSGDTLHVFVCHLPSRRGGALASARYRSYCCTRLREQVDSLMAQGGEGTHCLLLGDFNGDPEEAPTSEALRSRPIQQIWQCKTSHPRAFSPSFIGRQSKSHLGATAIRAYGLSLTKPTSPPHSSSSGEAFAM